MICVQLRVNWYIPIEELISHSGSEVEETFVCQKQHLALLTDLGVDLLISALELFFQ